MRMTGLNFPLIFTVLADYLTLFALAWASVFYLADEKLSMQPIRAGISLAFVIGPVACGREAIMMTILGEQFAKIKMKEAWLSRKNVYQYVRVIIPFVIAIPIAASYGYVHFQLAPLGWKGLLPLISFEYWVMVVVKDAVCMRWFHKILHSPRFYGIHRWHHSHQGNIMMFNSFAMTWTDLIVEDLGAVLIGVLIKVLLFGVAGAQLHLGSFFFVVWSDLSTHSANPWTVSLFNPVADFLIHPAVAHSLHHAIPSKHFSLVPWEHMRAKDRLKDVALYNKVFGTDVTFSLFIPRTTSE